ncbi:MAG TPA: TetR family transcriptional regulator [Sphingopyxis sp.]|jgi:AcrR family transcriptional regulator|uniref:TetR/AcrR family transcriptional regulator n=1 Tax=Sphingopyxis sp. TaxID=1908224 RepID=UPI002E0F2DBC|nr:TetR family transcriptional regulator [Sphingopyxis sp.]
MAKRSAAEAAETRRNIIEAAERQFAERGFAGTATAEIAKAANVTEGALFHHFRNKRELFQTVVKKVQDEFHEEIERHARSSGQGVDAFRAGARASLNFSQQPSYQKIVLIDAPAVLGTSEWRKIDSALGLETIAPVLRILVNKPELPDADVMPMAVLVLGYLNETAFALARDEKGVSIDSCMTLLESIIGIWVQTHRG